MPAAPRHDDGDSTVFGADVRFRVDVSVQTLNINPSGLAMAWAARALR